MKKFKKVVPMLMCCAMALSSAPTCMATTAVESDAIPILLTSEAAVLDVLVPTALPVSVSSKGVVSVADNLTIVNKSAAPVDITDISMSVAAGWTLKPYTGWSAASEAINSKMVSFVLNSVETKTLADGSVDFDYENATQLSMEAAGDVAGGDSIALVYNAGVTASTTATTDESIASITITCDWTPIS